MSLINQMLRDLEKRNSTDNLPPVKTYYMQVPRYKGLQFSHIILGVLATVFLFRQQITATLIDQPVTISPPDSPTQTAIASQAKSLPHIPTAQALAQNQPVAAPIRPLQFQTSKIPEVSYPTLTVPVPAYRQQNLLSGTGQAYTNLIPSNQVNAVTQNSTEFSASHGTNLTGKVPPIQHVTPQYIKHSKLRPRHAKLNASANAAPNEEALEIYPATAVHIQEQSAQSLETPNLEARLSDAKTLISQKKSHAAIQLLQSINPNSATKETYLALLAAANQQGGNAKQATETYQQLLANRPGKAEYWLGLAMAQEKNGNIKAAREAYAQALSKNPLNAPVIDYIKQRQTVLNSE